MAKNCTEKGGRIRQQLGEAAQRGACERRQRTSTAPHTWHSASACFTSGSDSAKLSLVTWCKMVGRGASANRNRNEGGGGATASGSPRRQRRRQPLHLHLD